MLILGIETSCDETGVALYSDAGGLLAESLHSQTGLHAPYGGVVPELASRDHIRHLLPLIHQTLTQSGICLADLGAIGYTAGPGLAGALLVGASVATALARARGIPALPVHHLEGHLLSPLMGDSPPAYPFVALLVSGGHTQFLAIEAAGQYRLLGETLDDAVGEAFDKTAQLLGLGYPGGPAVAALAELGDPSRIVLPRPMAHRGGLEMSFSGLKTAVALRVRAATAADHPDIAAAFEAAVVDILCQKALLALQLTGWNHLVVAGGVSANRHLRRELTRRLATRGMGTSFPPPALCSDNGAMIAFAAAQRLQVRGPGHAEPGFAVHPRWDLENYCATYWGTADP